MDLYFITNAHKKMRRVNLSIIIFLLTVLSYSFSFAQTNMEILQRHMKSKNITEEWVDKALELTEKSYLSEPKKVKEILLIIADIAKNISYSEGENTAYIQLADVYMIETKNDSSFNMIMRSLNEKQGFKESINRFDAYITLGTLYYEMDKYDSAMIALDNAEAIIDSKIDSTKIARLINSRANIYSRQGLFSEAVEEYLKCVQIFKKSGKEKNLAVIYNNLAMELQNFDEFETAINYFFKAIEINKKMDNLENLSMNYANIGIVYKEMGELDTALSYYQKSVDISRNLGNSERMAQNYLNMANIYSEKGDKQKALDYFNFSLARCIIAGIDYGKMLNYLSIAGIYIDLKEFDKALQNLDSATVYVDKLNLPREKMHLLKTFSELYTARGNYKLALEYETKYNAMKDSLFSEEKKKEILALEKEHKSQQNEIDSKLHEVESSQNLLYYIILFLLAALVMLSLLYLRSTREKKSSS